jgi:hypothetical protein
MVDKQLAGYEDKFQRLKTEWLKAGQHLSKHNDQIILMPYLQIIGMGPRAVPFLMTELRDQPNWWFPALEAITGENPVASDNKGDLYAMAADWLRWWEERQQTWKATG